MLALVSSRSVGLPIVRAQRVKVGRQLSTSRKPLLPNHSIPLAVAYAYGRGVKRSARVGDAIFDSVAQVFPAGGCRSDALQVQAVRSLTPPYRASTVRTSVLSVEISPANP